MQVVGRSAVGTATVSCARSPRRRRRCSVGTAGIPRRSGDRPGARAQSTRCCTTRWVVPYGAVDVSRSGSGPGLEPEVVVGHADYRRVALRSEGFRRTFAEVFRQRSLLFVGSGLTDRYLLDLFGQIVELYGPGSASALRHLLGRPGHRRPPPELRDLGARDRVVPGAARRRQAGADLGSRPAPRLPRTLVRPGCGHGQDAGRHRPLRVRRAERWWLGSRPRVGRWDSTTWSRPGTSPVPLLGPTCRSQRSRAATRCGGSTLWVPETSRTLADLALCH